MKHPPHVTKLCVMLHEPSKPEFSLSLSSSILACFSEVYTVPTLFFEATSLDGALLPWNALMPHLSHSDVNGMPWKCVTPEARHNGTPCFQLHPCSTKSWMKMLIEEEQLSELEGENISYLSLWLRLVSNAFTPTSYGRIPPVPIYHGLHV